MSWDFCKQADTSDFSTRFYNSIEEVDHQAWNSVLQNKNIYLSIGYLRSLEEGLKGQVEFRYILFYNPVTKEPVGISTSQVIEFEDQKTRYQEHICKVYESLKSKLLKKLGVRVLICGNVFACGENGFIFSDSINHEVALENLSKALFNLRTSEKEKNPVSVVLLKEFWPESFKKADKLKEDYFRDFMIDVNMVLNIHPSWNDLDDYLQSMVTKFRTKAKGVFKKSKEVESRDLSHEDILENSKSIELLYTNVVENADFNYGRLNTTVFSNLKKSLGNNFKFRAYYLGEEMVGFSTAFFWNGIMDANYVGLNYDYNFSHAVYQRILYDFVEDAIANDCEELRLGRTAEEIKSCLGAEPTNMKLYVKHKNSVSNHLLKHLVQSVSPSEFEIRKPFKASFMAQ